MGLYHLSTDQASTVLAPLKSISETDSSLLNFLQRLPKTNKRRPSSSQTFMTCPILIYTYQPSVSLRITWEVCQTQTSEPRTETCEISTSGSQVLRAPCAMLQGVAGSHLERQCPLHPKAGRNLPYTPSSHCFPPHTPSVRSILATICFLLNLDSLSTAQAQPHALEAHACSVLFLLMQFQFF